LTSDDETLTFILNPGYGSVRLKVERGGADVVDLRLLGINTVDVERVHNREVLRLVFRDPEVGPLTVVLKPRLIGAWSVGAD
jgi:hypothetical protein